MKDKCLNIRCEKKPGKYKGPKLVYIDQKLVEMKAKELDRLIRSGDVTDVIIITKSKTGKHWATTTLCNERTVYELDRVRNAYISN